MKIEKIFCPQCKGENIEPLMGIGGFIGTYRCRNCNYTGVFPIKKKRREIGGIKK